MDILNVLMLISIYSGVIFLVIMVFKKAFNKKISPMMHYYVWFILIARLLIPLTIDSGINLIVIPESSPIIQQAEPIQPETLQGSEQPHYSGTSNMPKTGMQEAGDSGAQLPVQTSASPVQKSELKFNIHDLLLTIWLAGIGIAVVYVSVSYLKVRHRIKSTSYPVTAHLSRLFESCKGDIDIRKNIRLTVQYGLSTPALFFPSHILMPMEWLVKMDDEQITYALRHELMHYKRKDHWVNLVFVILQSVYWFNPFVWAAVNKMRTDMEVACDQAVVNGLENRDKTSYANLIVSMFTERSDFKHLVLGLAQGKTMKTARKRIEGIFMNKKSSKSVKTICGFLAVVLLVTCFTTACQPTPETPAVAGKNDGVLESALSAVPGAVATPYDAPDTMKLDVDVPVENYSIVFDAQVDVPEQTKWPVYSVEMTQFTQEQADAVRLALLDGATLYKPGDVRSRAEVQRNIDYYEAELEAAVGYPELIDAYSEILKKLYIDYQSAPQDVELEEADTLLQYHEGQANAIMVDGNPSIVWLSADENKQNVIAAGGSSVYGVCWQKSGRKMEFATLNTEDSSNIFFGIAQGNPVQNPGATCTLEEAIEQGNALLTAAGLDFSLVNAQPENLGLSGKDCDCYALSYKRKIPDIPLDYIQSAIPQNLDEQAGEEAYRGRVPDQETLTIYIDDYGVLSFSWSQPLEVTATESENVPLIPFDEVESRISSQLKIQTMWNKDADADEEEWIESRRLEVNKIVLSYLVVAKSDSMSSFYLIPVWNVCGDLYYHYKDGYLNRGESEGYVLDENNERTASRQYRYDTAGHSMLTISAIDGTVIPRGEFT